MDEKNPLCMGVAETHNVHSQMEIRESYTWYFSGLDKKGNTNRTEAGVAVVIPNKYKNYILDLIPIYERIIVVICIFVEGIITKLMILL